jgi:hypothetical protein
MQLIRRWQTVKSDGASPGLNFYMTHVNEIGLTIGDVLPTSR